MGLRLYRHLSCKISAVYYTLCVYANYTPGAGLNDYKEEGGFDLNEVTFGMRLYTDETHSFEGVKKAAYEETHPLAVTVAENASGAVFVGYNPLRGLYEITMNGTGFNEAFADPSLRFSAPFTVKNGGDDRAIFVDAACLVSGGLECGVVLDAEGRQLAMDTQVSKNFQGDGGEWVYSAPDRQYSDMIFPVMAKAGAEESFTAVHLYQNWGDFPLKQISSIEYHTPYYHLSTGVTETNCISMQYMSDICYAMKEEMCRLYELTDYQQALDGWTKWFEAACASEIPALVKFATQKKRLPGLAAHAVFQISTGKLEGFNNKIKVAKRIAYGYRDEDYFFTLIRYLALPSTKAQYPNFP